jgi:hypothetical protein
MTTATTATFLTTTSTFLATTLFLKIFLYLAISCPFLDIDRVQIDRKPQHLGDFIVVLETSLKK